MLYNLVMPTLIGKSLGKVRVEMFLAKGGMAEVYIGTHTTLQRSVAIKFLKTDLQEDPDLRDRFEREARVIAMLRHPNIVQIFDFDSFLNQPYLVMEYIPGTSLGAYLRELHKKSHRLTLQQVLSLLKKVALALSYAHENNVIHRDVKPANILLTSRSTPVSIEHELPTDVEPILTDFGLVRFTQSAKQTSTGVITGTPAYMSPEQARGERVDARTDVYSLGVTVYEMLAGRVPFDADTTLSILHQLINDPHPPINGISIRLQSVMDKALEKDPKKRFTSPLEFAEAFENAVSESADARTVNIGSTHPKSTTGLDGEIDLSKTGKKRNILAPVLVGLISVVIALGITFNNRSTSLTTSTLSATEDHSHTTPPENENGSLTDQPVTDPSDPVGLLRFQDGSNLADQVTFSSRNLPLPPEDSHYEAWLVKDDAETRYSIGIIQFDTENKANLSFVDPNGRNLITDYHGFEITIEPNPDNNPNPSNDIAFLTMLPTSGYTHVRHLLSAFGATPNHIGLIHGLVADTNLLVNLSESLLTAFESGDETSVRLRAEQMLNVIVGIQSEDHKDWNGNGNIDDTGDGFGLLLNGTSSGYIQGVFAHANLSLTSPDATNNMLVHGEHVKIAATNLSFWTPLLRDQLIAVIESSSLTESESAIREAIVLTNQIHFGVDINGNENIEAILGEGGAMTAHDHSYYMADVLLLP